MKKNVSRNLPIILLFVTAIAAQADKVECPQPADVKIEKGDMWGYFTFSGETTGAYQISMSKTIVIDDWKVRDKNPTINAFSSAAVNSQGAMGWNMSCYYKFDNGRIYSIERAFDPWYDPYKIKCVVVDTYFDCKKETK